MPISCLIVDDEPLARERLVEYVGRLPGLELRGAVKDAAGALAFTRADPVQLVFLDVDLGGTSGIELLETAGLNAQVILTTAHDRFAVRAFELAVVDYLLKPFSFARFVQAVDRVRAGLETAAAPPDRGVIFVKTEFRLERVVLRQLLYISGDGDYRRLHTTAKEIMTLETFSQLEQRLPAEAFCRVHKSWLVAIDKVESVERDRIRIGTVLIPISETYREHFYSLIGQRKSAPG